MENDRFPWKCIGDHGAPIVRLGETWYGLAANANREEVFHSAEYTLHSWNTLTGEKMYEWRCEFGPAPDGYITHWAECPKAPEKEGE